MNELTEMDTEYVYRLLNLLTEFPLQQGELDEFTLNAKEAVLSGAAESQQKSLRKTINFSSVILQRLT